MAIPINQWDIGVFRSCLWKLPEPTEYLVSVQLRVNQHLLDHFTCQLMPPTAMIINDLLFGRSQNPKTNCCTYHLILWPKSRSVTLFHVGELAA